ncbi:MAG: helix-turn-helix transcriptional regulator [Bdellovibrionales bacterium]|nr:helix-turn-helix transcriptional regulator [Bdellovibrionales bacterium]
MDLAFSKILRELLQNRGMSTARLAKAVGISPKTVSDWMTGRVPRDLAAVRRCANHLNVSVHYLLYGEEDSQGPSTVSGHGEIHPGLYEITVKKVR